MIHLRKRKRADDDDDDDETVNNQQEQNNERSIELMIIDLSRLLVSIEARARSVWLFWPRGLAGKEKQECHPSLKLHHFEAGKVVEESPK